MKKRTAKLIPQMAAKYRGKYIGWVNGQPPSNRCFSYYLQENPSQCSTTKKHNRVKREQKKQVNVKRA